MREVPGIVYLVGAGPGDPGLLTCRGAEVLSRAEIVVYDHLASPRLLELAPRDAILLSAGKSIGHCTLNQDEINQILLEHGLAGRRVVRLKGGDPLVFGRGAEEAAFLRKSGIPFEIIPGITAGVGVTAYAGIPITHRDAASAVAFVTGHGDPEAKADSATGRSRLDWQALAHFPGTLIVYMGVTHLGAICRALIRRGKDPATPAAVVESGTLPSQRVFEGTLKTLPDMARTAGVHAPALLVIGQVVERRRELAWFEALPLFGQRIVITRPAAEAARSASMLEALGAEVLIAPTVEIRALEDTALLDAAIDRLREYDWLVFTSGNGVRAFFERLLKSGRDLRSVGSLKLACIGPSTAEALSRYHLQADLVPESYRSESLAEALAHLASGTRILLARADRGRNLLRDELDQLAQVDEVAVYRNRDASELPRSVVSRIREGTVDWITLTSSAITARLHALLPEDARCRIGREVKLASLSPVTSATANQHGWNVEVEARDYTWEGLVGAIAEMVSGKTGKG